MSEKLSADQAIAYMQECIIDNVKVLGVDGFILVPQGYVASLDLILDVSEPSWTIDDANSQAQSFIKEHARPDIVFEIFTE